MLTIATRKADVANFAATLGLHQVARDILDAPGPNHLRIVQTHLYDIIAILPLSPLRDEVAHLEKLVKNLIGNAF